MAREITVTARIVAGVGGRYTVLLSDPPADLPPRLVCLAKGAFRHEERKPLVGDVVTLRVDPDAPDDTAVIREIRERKNTLIRPPMANVTHLFVLFAAARPAPTLETVDKMLAVAERLSIRATVVVTKADLDPAAAERYAAIYRLAGYPVLLSAGEGSTAVEPLREALTALPPGGVAAFAGASGVGKSTLLNRLFPHLSLATGDVSRRILRGRHTTRSVDLYPIDPAAADPAFFADTPGFSLLDFARFDFLSLSELLDSFPDVAACSGECRYADCTHTGESADVCAVARAVADGRVAPSRHASYVALYHTLKRKENTYP